MADPFLADHHDRAEASASSGDGEHGVRWLAWTIVALTVLWCAAIVLDLAPWLRGPAEWRCELYRPLNLVPARLLAPLLVAAAIAFWATVTWRRRRLGVPALLALVLLAGAFRVAVQGTTRSGVDIVGRTMNPAYMSCFGPAAQTPDISAAMRDYIARHDELGDRQRDHPPGNTVFYWVFVQLARHLPAAVELAHPFIAPRRPAMESWFAAYGDADIVGGGLSGVAVLLLGCMAVVPLYRLGERLSGPRAAWLCVTLFAVLPAGTLFMPVIDDVQTIVAVVAALMVVGGTLDDRLVLVLGGGAVAGIGTFLGYSMLPAVMFLGLAALAAGVTDLHPPTLRRAIARAAVFTVGISLVWVVYWVGWGVDPIELFRLSMTGNYNAWLRSYWAWLVYNPYDMLLFAGAAVSVLVTVAAVTLLRRCLRGVRPSPADVVLAALLVTGTALFVSGRLRGETARTLLYAFPFLAWIAADIAVRLRAAGARMAALIIGLTAVETVLLHGSLRVYH